MENDADPALHLAIELVDRAVRMLDIAGAGSAAAPYLRLSLDLLEAERKGPDSHFPESLGKERDVRASEAGHHADAASDS